MEYLTGRLVDTSDNGAAMLLHKVFDGDQQAMGYVRIQARGWLLRGKAYSMHTDTSDWYSYM